METWIGTRATIAALCLALTVTACGPSTPPRAPALLTPSPGPAPVPAKTGVFAQMREGLLELRGGDLVFVQAPPDAPRLRGEQVTAFVV